MTRMKVSCWRMRVLTAVTGAVLASMAALLGAGPASAASAPPAVESYYVYGTTLSGMEQSVENDACTAAKNNPSASTLLVFDFGAARDNGSGWGEDDFSGDIFSNSNIYAALKDASDGFHNCYVHGTTTIVFGNSNDGLTASGMSANDAYNAGYWQDEYAYDLYEYEQSESRPSQAAAAGVDMEPSFDVDHISNELVNGASDYDGVVDYDYGSADGCPESGTGGSCNNGWTAFDVSWSSFSGVALPIPEIYVTAQAEQWPVIARTWNSVENTNDYYFAGITAESGELSPSTAWTDLYNNSGGIFASPSYIACFGC